MNSSRLRDQIVEIFHQLEELKRRARNRRRTGKIAEVDHAKGLARVELSRQNDKPFLTGWIPWQEIAAGGIKSHIPPTVGEQVDVVSENGDLTDAVIDMSTPSNANPRPHDGPEAVITKGDVRITIADNRTDIVSPLVVVDGNLKVLGRVHAVQGIHDTGGIFSEVGIWPPSAVYTPPVAS